MIQVNVFIDYEYRGTNCVLTLNLSLGLDLLTVCKYLSGLWRNSQVQSSCPDWLIFSCEVPTVKSCPYVSGQCLFTHIGRRTRYCVSNFFILCTQTTKPAKFRTVPTQTT